MKLVSLPLAINDSSGWRGGSGTEQLLVAHGSSCSMLNLFSTPGATTKTIIIKKYPVFGRE